jgi:hypothetical protein
MPEVASVSKLQISIIAESTRGTTPVSPAYKELPIHEGSFFQANRRYERSGVKRPNRMGGKQVGGTKDAQGGVTLSLVNEDSVKDVFESAVSGVFTQVTLTGFNGTFTSGTKIFTRASGSFLTDPAANLLKVGDKVVIDGSASNKTTTTGALGTTETTIPVTSIAAFNAGGGAAKIDSEWVTYASASGGNLNGVTRGAFGTTAATHSSGATITPAREITAISATDLTFANDTVVTEASFAATITSNRYRAVAGTTRKFFSVAQKYTDIAVGEFFTGEEINTLTVNIPTTGECTMETAFVGVGFSTTEPGGASYVATKGRTPMAGSITGTSLEQDGSALQGVRDLSIQIDNGRANFFQVGSDTAYGVGEGDFDATIGMGIYLSDLTQASKFQAGTRFSLLSKAKDQNDGHEFWFEFPRCVFQEAPKANDANVVIQQATAYAEEDPTLLTKMIVHWRPNK